MSQLFLLGVAVIFKHNNSLFYLSFYQIAFLHTSYYERGLSLLKMECVSNLVRKSLPGYLENLPIPDSIGGWFSLGVADWARLVPFGVAVGGLTYLSLQGLANTPVVGPPIKVS